MLAHIRMWTIWDVGLGTADSAQAMALLRPFGIGHGLKRAYPSVLQKGRRQHCAAHHEVARLSAATPGQQAIGEPGPSRCGRRASASSRHAPTQRRARQHDLALIDKPLDA